MNILIIGAGSIGLLFSKFLVSSGHHVEVCGNKNLHEKIEQDHLKFKNINGTQEKFESLHIYASITKETDLRKFDIVIISCKAYSLNQICLMYSNVLLDQKLIFLIQNGIGNEEIINDHYPKLSIVRVLTTLGSFFSKNGILSYMGKGKVDLSLSYFSNSYEINDIEHCIWLFQQCLSEQNIPCQYHKKNLIPIWEKALVNLSINGLGAIFRYKNGEILNDPILQSYIHAILKEALSVSNFQGISLQPLEYYIQMVFNVLENTKLNYNSLLQDLMKCKPTEINFLNGKIVQLGITYGIPTPINSVITNLIKNRENISKNYEI